MKGREKFDLMNFNIGCDTVIHRLSSGGIDIFRKRGRAYMQSRIGIFLHLESRKKRRSITNALRPDGISDPGP
jgi:hypothetical protein